MRGPKAKIAVRRKILFLGIIAPVLVITYASVFSRGIPEVELPSPNGYDDFLRATNLVGAAFDPQRRYPTTELRALVAGSAAGLKQLRIGLERECRVPLKTARDYPRIARQRLDALKRIASLFIAEGRLAEVEYRYSDAINSYLNLIQLAHELRRGGLVFDSMAGFQIEGLGQEALLSLMPRLRQDQLKFLMRALETIDERREPWSDVMGREKRYSKALTNPLTYIANRIVMAFIDQNRVVEEIAKRTRVELQLLLLECALRSYRSETGVFPDQLCRLSPTVLEALPSDPFSNQPYIYRTEQNRFILYSVGPDLKDDDGKPLNFFKLRRKGIDQGDLPSRTKW